LSNIPPAELAEQEANAARASETSAPIVTTISPPHGPRSVALTSQLYHKPTLTKQYSLTILTNPLYYKPTLTYGNTNQLYHCTILFGKHFAHLEVVITCLLFIVYCVYVVC
jgi:hypothetical protein